MARLISSAGEAVLASFPLLLINFQFLYVSLQRLNVTQSLQILAVAKDFI